jgi:hypothetical protein
VSYCRWGGDIQGAVVSSPRRSRTRTCGADGPRRASWRPRRRSILQSMGGREEGKGCIQEKVMQQLQLTRRGLLLTGSRLQEVGEVFCAHGLLRPLCPLRAHDSRRRAGHHPIALRIAVHCRGIAVLVLQIHLASEGVSDATAHGAHSHLHELLHLWSE